MGPSQMAMRPLKDVLYVAIHQFKRVVSDGICNCGAGCGHFFPGSFAKHQASGDTKHRHPKGESAECPYVLFNKCHIGPTEKVTMGMAMDSTLLWMYSRPKRGVKSAA